MDPAHDAASGVLSQADRMEQEQARDGSNGSAPEQIAKHINFQFSSF
jgi:hypothetical protein